MNNGYSFSFINVALGSIVTIAMVIVLIILITTFSVSGAISKLASEGYVVLAAGEYNTLTSNIASLQEDIDDMHDTLHHDSNIFPADTDLTCTLTADIGANTWSSWTEITDSGANTFSSLFASAKGHITECSIENLSEENTIYMIEIAYGTPKVKITSIRFAGGTKFQTPSAVQRLWAPPVPALETLYYRMKTATEAADTALVNFRYHYDV